VSLHGMFLGLKAQEPGAGFEWVEFDMQLGVLETSEPQRVNTKQNRNHQIFQNSSNRLSLTIAG
jgi:hypothetical protein